MWGMERVRSSSLVVVFGGEGTVWTGEETVFRGWGSCFLFLCKIVESVVENSFSFQQDGVSLHLT